MNGQPAKLEPRHSAGHIGYNIPRTYSAYAQVLPYENEWTWYLCEVPPGASRVHFQGAAADPAARFGLWLWAERDIAQFEIATGVECTEPALPPHNERIERTGICLK